MADLYRRERRRLRADALLIARKVDRETRRLIWRLASRFGPFSSLKRALRKGGYAPGGVSEKAAVWYRAFPGWHSSEAEASHRRASLRKARRAANRRRQRERMVAHQAEMRGVGAPWAPGFGDVA